MQFAVVRAFDDDNVTHRWSRKLLEDIEVINMELVLADLESVESVYHVLKKWLVKKIKQQKWKCVF